MKRRAVQLVFPIVFARALVLWALIRLAFAMLPLSGGAPIGSIPVPPIGIVMLTCVVALIDVRARGERILWANLGVTSYAICAVYAAAAVPAEIILAIVVR